MSIAKGTRAFVPDFVFLEIANGLGKYVRSGSLAPVEADQELAQMLTAPVRRVPGGLLTRQALALSIVRDISAYDAAYLAVAIGCDAVLVTADRRLAAEAERSALLPDQGPPE